MNPTSSQGPRIVAAPPSDSSWYLNITAPEAAVIGSIGEGKSRPGPVLDDEIRANIGRKVRVNPSPKHDLHDGTDNR